MHPFTAFVTKLLTFFSNVLCPNTDTIISTGILHVVVNHALDHFHIWFSRHFRNGSLGNTGTSIMLKCSSFRSEISRWRISLENVFFILDSSRHKIYHGIDLTCVDIAMRIAHRSHTCVVMPANESTFNDWRSFMIHEQQATFVPYSHFALWSQIASHVLLRLGGEWFASQNLLQKPLSRKSKFCQSFQNRAFATWLIADNH